MNDTLPVCERFVPLKVPVYVAPGMLGMASLGRSIVNAAPSQYSTRELVVEVMLPAGKQTAHWLESCTRGAVSARDRFSGPPATAPPSRISTTPVSPAPRTKTWSAVLGVP